MSTHAVVTPLPEPALPSSPEPRPRLAVVAGATPDWAGDPDAFAAVYAEHGRAVFGVAARICTPALAEDVTQEVFLRLWSRPDRWDPTRGTLRTFLLVMARHTAVDQLRSELSRRNREAKVGARPVAAPDGVDVRALLHERDGRVTAALRDLTPSRRDAIVTAFFGGVSYREAAVVLGVAEGTLKSRIRAGLVDLHVVLGDLDRDPDPDLDR